ncbi:MAG: CPBP family intramembrane metalloprotease [Treponema sp.]|nr:CPBP family intramembrane metalloprotease [Treponema sp.]
MNPFIEPLIVYFVLFLPGVFSGGEISGPLPFSVNREVFRILTYILPSLALLGYLIRRTKGFAEWGLTKPERGDFFSFFFAFPLLFLFGWVLSFFASRILSLPLPPRVEVPHTLLQWLVIFLSCIGTGYLEEGYFRFYLLKTFEAAGMGMGIFFSVLLFTLCHSYEGPWGMANAALAGFLLALVFKKWGRIHGIAWAHGAYNIMVYVLEA